jgi:hypothetical protein
LCMTVGMCVQVCVVESRRMKQRKSRRPFLYRDGCCKNEIVRAVSVQGLFILVNVTNLIQIYLDDPCPSGNLHKWGELGWADAQKTMGICPCSMRRYSFIIGIPFLLMMRFPSGWFENKIKKNYRR